MLGVQKTGTNNHTSTPVLKKSYEVLICCVWFLLKVVRYIVVCSVHLLVSTGLICLKGNFTIDLVFVQMRRLSTGNLSKQVTPVQLFSNCTIKNFYI